MSAAQIIEEIKRLPAEERLEIVQFARTYETVPMLSGDEIGELAQRMVDATDPVEIAELEKEIINGFYGLKVDA